MVARAIFMGTAPTHQQQNTGLDDKQINLSVVQPGERLAIFGDALRRLTNQAKFMHVDLGGTGTPAPERKPTRSFGTVMISAERPAREIHQIVEAIVKQLTTIPGSEVTLKLDIDAEVPGGLDRAKVRTLLENCTTLEFIEKGIS
jgi:hypothetical protein